MKRLFDDNLDMTDDARQIQQEFEDIIEPFYKKYEHINPIELEHVINSAVNLQNTRNYLLRVIEKHKL